MKTRNGTMAFVASICLAVLTFPPCAQAWTTKSGQEIVLPPGTVLPVPDKLLPAGMLTATDAKDRQLVVSAYIDMSNGGTYAEIIWGDQVVFVVWLDALGNPLTVLEDVGFAMSGEPSSVFRAKQDQQDKKELAT